MSCKVEFWAQATVNILWLMMVPGSRLWGGDDSEIFFALRSLREIWLSEKEQAGEGRRARHFFSMTSACRFQLMGDSFFEILWAYVARE